MKLIGLDSYWHQNSGFRKTCALGADSSENHICMPKPVVSRRRERYQQTRICLVHAFRGSIPSYGCVHKDDSFPFGIPSCPHAPTTLNQQNVNLSRILRVSLRLVPFSVQHFSSDTSFTFGVGGISITDVKMRSLVLFAKNVNR